MAELPKNLRIRPGVIGLDRLDPAVWEAVQQGARFWPGTVEVTSVGRHSGDRGNHSGGHAVDVKLYDEGGKPLSNIRDGGRHARDYEKFWQNGVAMASEAYPDLPNRARWGGNFLNSVGADYMHLDVTPGRSTAGGDLLHGANAAMRRKWGGQSEGIGDWESHREFLKTGRKPAPGLMAQAGEAALNFFMPAAQAAEGEDNPYLQAAEAVDQAPTAMPDDNPYLQAAEAVGQSPMAMPEENPYLQAAEAVGQGHMTGLGDTASSTAIQGTGLPPEALQATVPTGPVNLAPLAQPPYQPQALPPTPTQQMRSVLEGIGPLGGPMAATLPPDVIEQDQALEAVGSERLPEKVIGDFRGGAPGFSPNEFEGVRAALERGALQQPKSIRDLFVGAVPPRALAELDNAIAVHEAKRERLNAGPGPFDAFVPGGKVGLELLGRAVDEATLGAARPGLPVSGSEELQRLIGATNRANKSIGQDIQERFPVSSGVATLAGGVAPYALGLKGLRGVRSAAGLSPVGPGTLGQVAEGAQLGGPIEFLRKPEGEPTSPGEELQRRALQAGLGVALGAALDAGMGATGSAYDVARAGLGARKQRLGVEREARDAGFADARSYLDSLFKKVQTPDGVIAVPSRQVFDGSSRQSAPALPPPSSPQAAASGAVDSSPKPFVPGMLPAPEAKPTAAAPVEPTPRPATRGAADLVAEAERLEQTAAVISDPVAKQVLLTEAALRRQEADAVARGEQPKRTREEVQKARAKERVTVDPEKDDLVTAIRKLGGIDVDLESDWAGRLLHLNKKLIGIPGIERTGGKGRSLDDLAEALQERGYLHTRNKTELEARLWQAEKGEPQWSYIKSDYQAPERPPEAGTGGAAVRVSRERVAFEDVPDDVHWIIDPETGSLVPGSEIDENDLLDIEAAIKRDEIRRQREAEWVERERRLNAEGDTVPAGEQSGPVQDARGDGVSNRGARKVQGRAGDQSGPDQAGDFFGGLSDAEQQTADKLALEEMNKEKQRKRNANNAPPADEGLFGLDNRQTDMGTLYSNPIGAVAKNFAADVKEAPGRAVLEMLTGGALAGTWASKEEPGSMAWWRDVLVGGVLAKGGLGTLRRAGLTGKGQYFEKQVFGKLGGWIDGLPLIGQGPIGVRDLKREQQAVLARLNRQTENVGRFLLQQFKPSERAMMSDLIEGRGIVPEFDRVHRQAQALDEFLTDMGQQLKDLGMLPEDLELGGYLHRYYEKHLGVSKLFREAKRQSLSGTYSLARGTDGEFQREYLSPGARAVVEEFDAVQAEIDGIEKDIKRWDKDLKKAQKSDDPDLFMEKYDEAMEGLTERLEEAKDRLKEIRKTVFTEFVGEENGKAKSFIFKAGEVGRVESDVGPVKAHQFRPKAIEKAVGPAMPVKEIPELYPSARKWSLKGTKDGQVLLHRDWTEAERKAWGEIRDAGYRYVRGLSEATNDLSLAMMFKKIANNSAWVSDTPVDGWVKVGKDTVGKGSPMRKYGALAGKWVKPDVWHGVTRYGRSVLGNSRAARLYRDALNTWKLWHTADNPVTHFNNLFSNTEMLMLSGYGPRDLADALKHMRQGEKSKLWSEAADEGLFGNDFTAATLSEGGMSGNLQELAEALRTQSEIHDAALVTSTLMKVKQWWHDSGQHLREAKGTRGKAGALASMLGKPAAVAGKAVAKPYQVYARTMRKAYRFEDNLFKMAAYVAERRKGSTPLQAVEAAERYFFDYYDLPDAVRFARDLPIGSPFISYTYLAGKALIRTAIERPERILALVATFEGINQAAMRMNEEGGKPGQAWALEEAESALSAPWDRGRSLTGARNMLHLPSPDGYRVALGNAHVLGNPFQSDAGGREKLPEMPLIGKAWGSSIFGGSPAHALLDVAINEDWKGKPIYGEYDTPADKTAKALAYWYRAFMPSTPVFPGSHHQGKILEGMANDAAEARARGDNSLAEPVVQAANAIAEGLGFQQLTGKDRMRNPIDTTEAVLGSVGIKLRPPGYDQTLDVELGNLQKERGEIKAEFRKKGRDFAEKRYTKEQFQRYQDEFWARMEEVDAREEKLFEARKTLKAAGFPLKRSKKRKLQ